MRLRYERRAGELLIDYEMWGGWKAEIMEGDVGPLLSCQAFCFKVI